MNMTDEEKIKFLKKMGYSGSLIQQKSIVPPPKEKVDRSKNLVDKSELLNLNRIFNGPKTTKNATE